MVFTVYIRSSALKKKRNGKGREGEKKGREVGREKKQIKIYHDDTNLKK